MNFGELSAALAILDRLRNAWSKWAKPPKASIAARFVQIFERHGVHRNQIPRFVQHGLSLRDVQDDLALTEKLSDPILEAACTLFSVRREWLDGADEQAHKTHNFYKDPEAFRTLLGGMNAQASAGLTECVLLSPMTSRGDEGALLIISEPVGDIGERTIYRHTLCPFDAYSYWKTRAYLTACVALAWKHGLFVRGYRAPWNAIKPFARGLALAGWNGEDPPRFTRGLWHPEEMAIKPDVFLEGVHAERGSFGHIAGLSLWLELEGKGLMNIDDDRNVRAAFEEALHSMRP